MTETYTHILPSPFGHLAIVWSEFIGRPRILRVILSSPDLSAGRQARKLFPESVEGTCVEIDSTGRKMLAFLSGEDSRFSLGMIRLDLCTEFQRDVLRAEHGIPRGRVSTYQRIAKYLGQPNGARAVGNALAKNPFPIIIPCHRAIRSDRSLGGYQGGLEMKRALLEMEGIEFDEDGLVVTERFFY